MIMAAVALGEKPTLDEMKVGLAGNLCRCTGYSAIYRSIAAATGSSKNRNRRKREKALTAETAEPAERRTPNTKMKTTKA